MCDFKPGDEVVCVDDRRVIDARFSPAAPLIKGGIYTVTEVYFRKETGSVCVKLAEQKNISAREGGDVGFFVDRFRKVQRRNLTEWLSQKTKFEEPKRVGENA